MKMRDGNAASFAPSLVRRVDAPPLTLRQPIGGVAPLLTESEAATYLAVSPRHLRDRADIPRLDIAAAGMKPMWRYRLCDLEQWAEGRIVQRYPVQAS